VDVTSGLGYPRKTRGKPQNRIRRLAGLIHRFPRSHLANTTGTTCRNPREKRDSRWDRRSTDILAISSSEQRFRYIPLQRIPGIPGVNEAVPRPICYVTTPAWASRLAGLPQPNDSPLFRRDLRRAGQHHRLSSRRNSGPLDETGRRNPVGGVPMESRVALADLTWGIVSRPPVWTQARGR
jgi:hypothetical protein